MTAKVGDAGMGSRTRIVPPLPWKFTFDGLNDPPLSWVGARYRHVIRDGRRFAGADQNHHHPQGRTKSRVDGTE